GLRFTGATEVNFAGSKASFTVVNDGQLTAIVPAGFTTADLNVVTPDGSAVSVGGFTVNATLGPPIVATFRPAGLGEGGSANVTDVSIGYFDAKPVTQNDTQLTFLVPVRARSGAVTVRSSVGSTTSAMKLTVQAAAPPLITGVFPPQGPAGRYVFVTGFF